MSCNLPTKQRSSLRPIETLQFLNRLLLYSLVLCELKSSRTNSSLHNKLFSFPHEFNVGTIEHSTRIQDKILLGRRKISWSKGQSIARWLRLSCVSSCQLQVVRTHSYVTGGVAGKVIHKDQLQQLSVVFKGERNKKWVFVSYTRFSQPGSLYIHIQFQQLQPHSLNRAVVIWKKYRTNHNQLS